MERNAPPAIFPPLPLTPDQIVAGARRLPRGQSAELFDRLLADTVDPPDPEIGQAWKIETRRRIAEIETGAEPGVPGVPGGGGWLNFAASPDAEVLPFSPRSARGSERRGRALRDDQSGARPVLLRLG